jgi:hypothetical protein
MKDAIKSLILSGCTITHSYKSAIEAWFGTLEITAWDDQWMVRWDDGHKVLSDIDQAVQLFGELAYGKRNLANAYDGIEKHNLFPLTVRPGYEFEDLTTQELQQLIDQYFLQFHAEDFPFAKEFNID